jgi:hypothetical protein
MRSNLLLPLTALVAVAAGCRFEAPKPAARTGLERDLTLVTPTADVSVASALETRQLRSPGRTVRHARLAARVTPVLRSAEPPIHLAVVKTFSSAPAAAPVAQPANNRELLPGKTVTVIPASDSSSGTNEADEPSPLEGRTKGGHGGGTCRGGGRGPGIGMAPAPRPDFRVSY